MSRALVVLGLIAGCHPRLSMGTDMSARVTGPLANLQAIPRLAPTAANVATVPPEGRNYSAGVAFGDRRMAIGLRVHANNISGSTLDLMTGPQYVSGAAAIDMRWAMISYKGIALMGLLAPSYTMLMDTTVGKATFGEGMRYGGSVQLSVGRASVFVDAYDEVLMFLSGPAEGNSHRTGITVGLAVQP